MILYLNCQKEPEQKSWTKADYLLAAAAHIGWQEKVKLYNNEEAPEYVLNIEPYTRLVKGSKHTAIWEIDLLCDRPEMNDYTWSCADTVFIAISSIPQRLESMKDKTILLFQAADPRIHQRYAPPEFDFVFSGTMAVGWYAERERIFTLLKKKYTFKDFGKGHTPFDYAKTLSHGRIQVIRSMGTPIASGELAQRFFESMAIGPVLTNYVSDLPKTGFIEGEDYFSYKNDEELVEKMDLLLKNPEQAAAMAFSGRKKTLLSHTYEHRLLSIHTIMSYA